MHRELLSVGLDVGTTTTQMVVSRLAVANQASSFAVPDLQITERKIVYRSPVHFTPLLEGDLVDGEKLRQLVAEEYAKAGITPGQVDTGAVIITGETSRKENANTVLHQLSDFAGEFVVATAGPDLESRLAAKGAGAVAYSEATGKTVLHIDIGGGTSNLALIKQGRIVATGCLNVGGRLLKFTPEGKVTYVSPVIRDVTDLQLGQVATLEQVQQVAKTLTQALEMAAGLREGQNTFQTAECASPWQAETPQVISFSGGVADCIGEEKPPFAFGDMGSILGKTILDSRLCQGTFVLGKETIRATVIGAGCHSTDLSGSTVFYENVSFPLKNLPVAPVLKEEMFSASALQRALDVTDTKQAVLYLPGLDAPDYERVKQLAQVIAESRRNQPVYLCLEKDMAKALGHCLRMLRKTDAPCLCMDGLALPEDSYLDIGAPVGPALPVVIKTLIL